MTGDGHQHQPSSAHAGGSWLRSRNGLALLGFLAVAAFFLLTEHTAHVFGALPYVFLLSCVLLHLFMHGGHGGHGGHDVDGGSRGADAGQR